VDEYDIDPKEGVYGWATRHVVVARRITDYKFSSLQEMSVLFQTIIANINPAVPIELQSVRDICDREYGIGRLGDTKERQKLYRLLIEAVPGERIPWHRLIRELLSEENLEETEYVIRNAEKSVGSDTPIDRYRVRLLLSRAQKTLKISTGDRVAMLRRAYEMASRNTEKHKWDKLSYFTLCDVAVQLVQRGENKYVLEEAIDKLKTAYNTILDPEMPRKIRDYQDALDRIL